jgi:hypothetical protein
MYIIFLYQIRIFYICFSPLKKKEKYENMNKTFRLFNRNELATQFNGGEIRTQFDWNGPLYWARNKNQNFYGDDNNQDHGNGPSCDNQTVLQLTELVVTTKQALQDARAAYANLSSIYNDILTVDANNNDALTKLKNEISDAADKMKVP